MGVFVAYVGADFSFTCLVRMNGLWVCHIRHGYQCHISHAYQFYINYGGQAQPAMSNFLKFLTFRREVASRNIPNSKVLLEQGHQPYIFPFY